MASKEGTSRSNLINRILAQQINLPTAETMVNDVFSSIEQFMAGHSSLAVQLLGSGSLINMRSALRYKYNPSVKYTVEIFEKGEYLGQLKVSMRSQNKTLIDLLSGFFYLWATMEMQYAGVTTGEFEAKDGRYTRLFRIGSAHSYNDYGRSIAYYIDLMDRCMKEYFNHYSASPALARQNAENLYRRYMHSDVIEL